MKEACRSSDVSLHPLIHVLGVLGVLGLRLTWRSFPPEVHAGPQLDVDPPEDLVGLREGTNLCHVQVGMARADAHTAL